MSKSYNVETEARLKRLDDQCPMPHCGGELDTGYECNKCGYDALYNHAITPEQLKRISRSSR